MTLRFVIRKYILISARPINSPISGSILLDYFYTGYNLDFPIYGILNKENITPRNFMEAAFVLARCFPISCSRGAAYTGLHRLAVATQASCFGGLLSGDLQLHFISLKIREGKEACLKIEASPKLVLRQAALQIKARPLRILRHAALEFKASPRF